MKRDVFVLGVFLFFLGLILASTSRRGIEFEETWGVVSETPLINPPKETLSLEGHLEAGDKFRVYFTIQVVELPRPTPSEIGVIEMNLTDPDGNVISLPNTLIGVQREMPYPLKIPEGVANVTGLYKVDAKAFPTQWILLESLRLEKFEIKKKEPYGALLPIGVAVSGSGIVLSVFGLKSSKRRKRKYKGYCVGRKM
jgi:hypothetical protein